MRKTQNQDKAKKHLPETKGEKILYVPDGHACVTKIEMQQLQLEMREQGIELKKSIGELDNKIDSVKNDFTKAINDISRKNFLSIISIIGSIILTAIGQVFAIIKLLH